MRISILLTIAATLTATIAIATPASARDIPYQTPGQLKSTCAAAGGDYLPSGPNGVYGCQLKDGNIISCGGLGRYAKTCSNPAPKGSGTVVRDHRARPPVASKSAFASAGGQPVARVQGAPKPASDRGPAGPARKR